MAYIVYSVLPSPLAIPQLLAEDGDVTSYF